MDINADFTQRAVVHAARIDWVASPMPGVDRRMLDRIGDEVARATSIVRYAPGSAFSPHVHTGGEEYLVLGGVFQDEHGDFPVGSYVRNPPHSSHTPRSDAGATIFVKLWQFDPDDRAQVHVDTAGATPMPAPERPGVAVIPLFTAPQGAAPQETVRIEVWSPGASVDLTGHGGLEVLVIEGGFTEGTETFAPLSWLRLPPDQPLRAVAGTQGARVWIKSGHLRVPPSAPAV